MQTQTLEKVDVNITDDDDKDHLYCCDKDSALCGYDLTGANDIGDDILDTIKLCVLCDLTDICPLCGKGNELYE